MKGIWPAPSVSKFHYAPSEGIRIHAPYLTPFTDGMTGLLGALSSYGFGATKTRTFSRWPV